MVCRAQVVSRSNREEVRATLLGHVTFTRLPIRRLTVSVSDDLRKMLIVVYWSGKLGTIDLTYVPKVRETYFQGLVPGIRHEPVRRSVKNSLSEQSSPFS